MYNNLFLILAIIIYCYESRRPRIVLSTIPPMLEYYLSKIEPSTTFEFKSSSKYFNFTLRKLIPAFDIGNAELDERKQYITYHNISVTYSFRMRLKELNEPNHMLIGRDDCIAHYTFDLRL